MRYETSRRLYQETCKVLVGGAPEHIFNLGHRILAETPLDNAAELVKFVHDFQLNQWS